MRQYLTKHTFFLASTIFAVGGMWAFLKGSWPLVFLDVVLFLLSTWAMFAAQQAEIAKHEEATKATQRLLQGSTTRAGRLQERYHQLFRGLASLSTWLQSNQGRQDREQVIGHVARTLGMRILRSFTDDNFDLLIGLIDPEAIRDVAEEALQPGGMLVPLSAGGAMWPGKLADILHAPNGCTDPKLGVQVMNSLGNTDQVTAEHLRVCRACGLRKAEFEEGRRVGPS